MPSIINSSTSAGLITTGSTDGSLALQTNSGVTALTIDTSQNVGIGLTPTNKLDVKGAFGIQRSTNNETSTITMEAGNFDIKASPYGYPITFFTGTGGSSSERMRIDTSGNLLVGTTSGTARLYVKSNSNTSPTTFVIERSDTTDKWGQIIDSSNNYYFNLNGTGKAYINNSSGNWTPVSDQRAKKDIDNIQYGLKEILGLRAVSYRMNEDAEDAKKHLGFIAQEVKAILDEAVDDTKSEEQLYGLDKSVLVPVLVKAIQEQQALIQTLQTQVAQLQAKVGA